MSKFQGCGGIFPEFSGRKPDFSLIFCHPDSHYNDRSGFPDHNLDLKLCVLPNIFPYESSAEFPETFKGLKETTYIHI